jgi:hypothetical protein
LHPENEDDERNAGRKARKETREKGYRNGCRREKERLQITRGEP